MSRAWVSGAAFVIRSAPAGSDMTSLFWFSVAQPININHAAPDKINNVRFIKNFSSLKTKTLRRVFLPDFALQKNRTPRLTFWPKVKILYGMKSDPLALALRNVIETKALLEALIVSSESFDYPQAKAALKKLQRKVTDLRKLQAQLQSQVTPMPANVCSVDFKNTRPLRATK